MRRSGKGEWVEEDMIMNTKLSFARAFAIVSGVAIVAITPAEAKSTTRRDRCPYYPSPIVCRGEQSAATGAHESAANAHDHFAGRERATTPGAAITGWWPSITGRLKRFH
jgi:hypothetical protein